MKILVTGASGFTGHYMVDYLLALPGSDLEIFGLYKTHVPSDRNGCRYIQGDLCNRDETRALIRSVSPDAVLHLAGINRGTLHDLLRINVLGTQNLLDAVVQERPDCRVLVVGSSAEYGYAGSDPIAEDAPLRPVGAYGISKVAEDLLARSYASVHKLNVAVVRPFNLIRPPVNRRHLCVVGSLDWCLRLKQASREDCTLAILILDGILSTSAMPSLDIGRYSLTHASRSSIQGRLSISDRDGPPRSVRFSHVSKRLRGEPIRLKPPKIQVLSLFQHRRATIPGSRPPPGGNRLFHYVVP